MLRDGTEHPIAYVSRTFTPICPSGKRCLSNCVWDKKIPPIYIYGRRFTLVTDHKPLLTILGPKTGIPSLAAARMPRWSFLLSAYQYDIIFKPTAAHCNADGLSRLPQESTPHTKLLLSGADIQTLEFLHNINLSQCPKVEHGAYPHSLICWW